MRLNWNKLFRPLILVFCVLLVALTDTDCTTAEKQRKSQAKILIVHSYHNEYPWTRAEDDGIKNVFKNKGFEIDTFFMDTKRKPGENHKKAAGRKALELVKRFEPDIVITTDDNAQEYVGKFLVNDEKRSVVFCGVNEDISKYGYPGNNVTGIREHPYILSSLDLLKKVVPGVETFTVLTDKSPTSSGFVAYLKSLNLPFRIDKIIETDQFEQWKKEGGNIESDAVITYMYHTIRHNGNVLPPEDVIAWTAQHITKPTVGFFDFSIEGGVLLGHVESGFEHGELAAKKALLILGGKRAGEISVSTARKGLMVVNKTTAGKLRINLDPIKNITDKTFE
jgi:ABC-type uncharacterized transport system substrate-binding protein